MASRSRIPGADSHLSPYDSRDAKKATRHPVSAHLLRGPTATRKPVRSLAERTDTILEKITSVPPRGAAPPFSPPSTNIQGFAFCICIPGLLALGLQSVCVHACGTLARTLPIAALLRHTGRRHLSSRSSWREGRRVEGSDVGKGAWWKLNLLYVVGSSALQHPKGLPRTNS